MHHRMGLEVTRKNMSARIATNVNSERIPILKVMPLFIKNFAMKMVFDTVGECKSCLCMSNLGVVQVPDAMRPYIRRMDFIIVCRPRHRTTVGSLPGAIQFISI